MSTSPAAIASEQQYESVVAANMARFGQRVHICSLHFMPRKMERDYYSRLNAGANTRYFLEAVMGPKVKPSVCVVLDGYQKTFMGTNDNTHKPTYAMTEWTAAQIANDLVNDASGAPPAGPEHVSNPAIWISKCGTPQAVNQGVVVGLMPGVQSDAHGKPVYSAEWATWGTPSFAQRFPEFAQECAAFARRQWQFCERMVLQGDNYADGPQKDLRCINEVHRLAASYIGASQAEHPWMSPSSFGEMAACPFCGAKTSTKAPKCQNCHEIINQALYDQVSGARAKANERPVPPPPMGAGSGTSDGKNPTQK